MTSGDSALRWRLVAANATSGFTFAAGMSSVAVALLLGVTTQTSSFLPGLADPLNFSLTACLYLGPVGAGVAASQVARIHRLGLVALASSTPRGAGAAKAMVILPVIGWQLSALIVLVALVMLRSDLSGARSMPMSLLLTQAVALLVATTVAGAAVADAWQPRLVAPLVAATVFVVLCALALQAGGLGRFSPVYTDIYYRVPLQPNHVLLIGLSLMLVALALCGIGKLATSPAVVWAAVVIGGGVLLAGTVVVLGAGDDRTEFRTQPDSPLCRSEGGVRLCMWPESSKAVTSSLSALVRVESEASRFIDVPDTFYEFGLRHDSPGQAAFRVPPRGEGTEVTSAVLAMLPMPCDADESQRAFGL